MDNTIEMVIGSWGSYNKGNIRSLGSEWINLWYYDDWDDITELLEQQGFELDGLDQELFIQDIQGIEIKDIKNKSPKEVFETIKKSGVLDDEHLYEKMEAFIDVRGYDNWQEFVEYYEDDWGCNVHLFKNYDWEDYGRHQMSIYNENLPRHLEEYFDFEEYGKDMGQDVAEEYSDGIIEIYD